MAFHIIERLIRTGWMAGRDWAFPSNDNESRGVRAIALTTGELT